MEIEKTREIGSSNPRTSSWVESENDTTARLENEFEKLYGKGSLEKLLQRRMMKIYNDLLVQQEEEDVTEPAIDNVHDTSIDAPVVICNSASLPLSTRSNIPFGIGGGRNQTFYPISGVQNVQVAGKADDDRAKKATILAAGHNNKGKTFAEVTSTLTKVGRDVDLSSLPSPATIEETHLEKNKSVTEKTQNELTKNQRRKWKRKQHNENQLDTLEASTSLVANGVIHIDVVAPVDKEQQESEAVSDKDKETAHDEQAENATITEIQEENNRDIVNEARNEEDNLHEKTLDQADGDVNNTLEPVDTIAEMEMVNQPPQVVSLVQDEHQLLLMDSTEDNVVNCIQVVEKPNTPSEHIQVTNNFELLGEEDMVLEIQSQVANEVNTVCGRWSDEPEMEDPTIQQLMTKAAKRGRPKGSKQGQTAPSEAVRRKGVHLASRCCACVTDVEDIDHLLWFCPLARELWNWIVAKFHVATDFWNFTDAIDKGKSSNSLICNIWMAAILGGQSDGAAKNNLRSSVLVLLVETQMVSLSLSTVETLALQQTTWRKCTAILEGMEIAVERSSIHLGRIRFKGKNN
ncbi:hypothetical protein IFM89_030764 [Coptis chinensis]|uniref:Reverse transcriptase zinc-binding domain-containing protein n=1 Tax=Coptis chinensis TaxID=261450 RepID=A0A835HZ13_9MAGN|nr:hypothetical protein IFM89_030764 [Coptis chinensis]